MRRIKRSPYGKLSVEVKPVSVEGCETVYFAKMPTTPDTDPTDLQEMQRRQAKVSALIFQASIKLAAEKGISPEDARSMFFSSPDGVEVSSVNFMDYLSAAETESLLLVQAEKPDFQVKTATMMMQRRLAFHVAVADRDGLIHSISDPWFDLNPGDRLKFGDQIVTIKKLLGDKCEFSGEVPAGSIGFLVKPDGDYALGDPGWTEKQTRSDLSLDQIFAIYQFYEGRDQVEEGNLIEAQKDPGPPVTTSTDLSTPQSSTGGETSTPNAVPSVFQRSMIASATTNSATPP